MEGIFYVKKCGTLENVPSKSGETLNKRTVVLSTKECRVGDSGTYCIDQDLVFDLFHDRAVNFNVAEGQLLVISYGTVAREINGNVYAENRLNRYCPL